MNRAEFTKLANELVDASISLGTQRALLEQGAISYVHRAYNDTSRAKIDIANAALREKNRGADIGMTYVWPLIAELSDQAEKLGREIVERGEGAFAYINEPFVTNAENRLLNYIAGEF